MTNKLLFTIIIPIFNAEKYLDRCIKSVLKQSYREFQVVLVDDGSKDRSGEICDYYAKHSSQITVIHKQNEGVSAARNDGIRVAEGDYIGFVDADDTIEEDCLMTLFQLLRSEYFDCVSFGINKIFVENGEIVDSVQDTHGEAFWRNPDEIRGGIIELFPNMTIASVCNKVYTKDIIKNKNFIEMMTGEDFLFNIEVLQDISSFAVLNNCLYDYYRNKKEKTRANSYTLKYIDDIEAMYKAVLSLFRNWEIKQKDYYQIIDDIMYGMFHNVLVALPREEYKKAIRRPYVRKAFLGAKSYSWKERIYKLLLLMKAFV